MRPSPVILAVFVLTAGKISVNTSDSPSSDVTPASLIQADRDFAVATHSRGIEGWMSFYSSDAIRIRYRSNMVKGYDEVRKYDTPNISDTTVTLNWEPTDAYVFRDGAIGSTTGRYWIVTAGRRRRQGAGRGRYVTMWRPSDRWLSRGFRLPRSHRRRPLKQNPPLGVRGRLLVAHPS
jgi:hypothetical protein